MPKKRTAIVPASALSPAAIEARIHLIRGARVMLDSDLGQLYRVETKTLNQAVSRNAARFPSDFAFRLNSDEVANLRSQFVTSSLHGGLRYAPRVFTEQGVAMLSSVLRSRRAVSVNIAIMRVFVHIRELLVSHSDLARRIDDLEERYDGTFADVFEAIRELTAPTRNERRPRIGFVTGSESRGRASGAAQSRSVRRRHR